MSHVIRVIDFETTGMEPPAQVCEAAYCDLTHLADGSWEVDEWAESWLCAVDALPSRVRLHLLGFGKIEELSSLEEFGVTSFDTTSPLLRAFKDARKNYWMRSPAGDLSYYTAIRIPQATENNKLKHKALEGSLNQEDARRLEDAALKGVRAYAAGGGTLDQGLDAVMDYWAALNWDDETSPSRRADAAAKQRKVYAQTLADRPWEQCACRVCRESGVEALIFRTSNRNKRRGIHNLHVFHTHLSEFRQESL